VKLVVNNFNKWFLDLPIFNASKLFNPKHDPNNAPQFLYIFLFWFIKISIARWSLLNNSYSLCLNLKKYEIISHDLEDPRVTNKLPSLINWCVCLQKCIPKFNDAFFKVKLLSWWVERCNICKADLDHNIMAQQTSNNEMWVAKRSNIGPQVNK
jgi:hypothetical protein